MEAVFEDETVKRETWAALSDRPTWTRSSRRTRASASRASRRRPIALAIHRAPFLLAGPGHGPDRDHPRPRDRRRDIRRREGFAEDLGKTRDRVARLSGFLGNWMLGPTINEAVFALMESTGSADDIDAGARLGLNHPMGLLELSDFIGNDVMLNVMDVLYRGFGDPEFGQPRSSGRWSPQDTWAGRRCGCSWSATTRCGGSRSTDDARGGATTRPVRAQRGGAQRPRHRPRVGPARGRPRRGGARRGGALRRLAFHRAGELGITGLLHPSATAEPGSGRLRGRWPPKRWRLPTWAW